MFNGS